MRFPRFFRRLRLPGFRLPSRWHRQWDRFRGRLTAAAVYPFALIGYLFAEVCHRFLQWWSHRNLRYLLQGLPAVLLAVGVVVFAAVVYFQDRSLLANQYQGWADH